MYHIYFIDGAEQVDRSGNIRLSLNGETIRKIENFLENLNPLIQFLKHAKQTNIWKWINFKY